MTLGGSARYLLTNDEITATVALSNPSSNVALMTHLVLRDAATGRRILPAYYSDNYVSLLPGEKREIAITCAAKDAGAAMKIAVDGWNVSAGAF